MKKGKKLNLNELKVKSFVTEFVNGKENTAKGGYNVLPKTALNCKPTFGMNCTFDECFSQGAGCSDYQVC